MALQNLFGNIALDASVQAVKTAVENKEVLTDAQLRAAPVPVAVPSGIAVNSLPAGLASTAGQAAIIDAIAAQQPLTNTQLRASNVPVVVGEALPAGNNKIGSVDVASALPAGNNAIGTVKVTESVIPTGAATEASVAALLAKTPAPIIDMPFSDTPSIPVRVSPEKYTDVSFSSVGSGFVTPEFNLIGTVGAGMAVNQSAGNLVITTGTTANAEVVGRSVTSFNGALTLKEITTLSQRIVNNNFYVELVDVIGDTLAYNIVNATTLDVTKTAHGFTAANVGQRMDWCALSSVGVPQEVVIASIPDVNTIRFTTVGNPVSGSGNCSLTGWNKIELAYNGTGATAVFLNTRRRGWQNTSTSHTVATSASGHMVSLNIENGIVSLADKTVANTVGVLTNRGAFDQNIPQPDIDLYLQIRAKNGTTNPASTTTWTLGMVRIEDYIAQQMSITSVRQSSLQTSLPVSIVSPATVPVSGTVTAAGQAAHGAAVAGNPTRAAMRATSAAVAVATGQTCDQISTLYGSQITKPFSIPELEWAFAGAAITNTSDVVLASAAGAGLRRYLTSVQIDNVGMAAHVVEIKDGSTVIWRGAIAAGATRTVQFLSPLRTTANTALNVAVTTTPTGIYVNAQGYTAP